MSQVLVSFDVWIADETGRQGRLVGTYMRWSEAAAVRDAVLVALRCGDAGVVSISCRAEPLSDGDGAVNDGEGG